jgi:hypothetical protein
MPLHRRALAGIALTGVIARRAQAQAAPLPSWRDTLRHVALPNFIAAVTTSGSVDFVRPAWRIAGFDDDGTLGFLCPPTHAGRYRRAARHARSMVPPLRRIELCCVTRPAVLGEPI